jgi:hypothetical protein
MSSDATSGVLALVDHRARAFTVAELAIRGARGFELLLVSVICAAISASFSGGLSI